MNAAQRIILKIVLVIDVLFTLYPPFEVHGGYGRLADLGYHWLLFPIFGHYTGARMKFVELAAEILIASVIGFTPRGSRRAFRSLP